MVNNKRIFIAAVCGLIAGVICISGGKLLFGMTFTPLGIVYVLSSRLLIGFVIGISALRFHWFLHGILIGLIVGFPFPVYDLIIGQKTVIALAAFIMGPVFGVMIEFVTTVFFKAGNTVSV